MQHTDAAPVPEQGEWSEHEFQMRINARAAELGKSTDQLLIEAGLSRDTLDHAPTTGRRLDTLIKLAKVCNWSLRRLLGFRTSPELLRAAMTATQRTLLRLGMSAAEHDDTYTPMVARTYDLLVDLSEDGQPVTEAMIRMLVEYNVLHWRRGAEAAADPATTSLANPKKPPRNKRASVRAAKPDPENSK